MKIIFILLMLVFTKTMGNFTPYKFIDYNEFRKQKIINCFCEHESNFNDTITGDNGKAKGILQIHKIMVDEANNILGYKKFTYSDRLDKYKSIELFRIIQNKHNPEWDLKKACYIWNAGRLNNIPKSTNIYVKKISFKFKKYNLL